MTAFEHAATEPAAPHRRREAGALALAVAVIAALLAGLSGCSLIGDALQQKTTFKENLEYQKISAKKFRSNWPQVEIITFTQEGNIDGAGQWSANAVVTIGGKEYREIIGPWTTIGETLPAKAVSITPAVTVNYSDGSSEVPG